MNIENSGNELHINQTNNPIDKKKVDPKDKIIDSLMTKSDWMRSPAHVEQTLKAMQSPETGSKRKNIALLVVGALLAIAGAAAIPFTFGLTTPLVLAGAFLIGWSLTNLVHDSKPKVDPKWEKSNLTSVEIKKMIFDSAGEARHKLNKSGGISETPEYMKTRNWDPQRIKDIKKQFSLSQLAALDKLVTSLGHVQESDEKALKQAEKPKRVDYN